MDEKTGYAELEKQEWRYKTNETSFCHYVRIRLQLAIQKRFL